jgi:hypothetical protein
MGIFGKKQQRAQSSDSGEVAGASELERLIDVFLHNCGTGNTLIR